VLNKIKYLEDTFRKAHDFANTETGAGLMEKGTFKEEVEKMCPFYYDLLDVMGDRSAARPKVTSDIFDDSSDKDEEDEELVMIADREADIDVPSDITQASTPAQRKRSPRPSTPLSGGKSGRNPSYQTKQRLV